MHYYCLYQHVVALYVHWRAFQLGSSAGRSAIRMLMGELLLLFIYYYHYYYYLRYSANYNIIVCYFSTEIQKRSTCPFKTVTCQVITCPADCVLEFD